MRNQTDMMREILKNETAQRIINFVSPIYGNSYVGLWIYESIGVVMDEIFEIANRLQYETTPATADLLLEYWEDHYEIPRNNSLTPDQRRCRILEKMQSRLPCTPHGLEAAVSMAIDGIPVEVTENVGKNLFFVTIKGSLGDISLAIDAIERKKPAHLIYHMQAQMEAEATDLRIAGAITHAESHELTSEFLLYEEAETSLLPASVITHAENFTVEVFN